MTACTEPVGSAHSALFYRGEREYLAEVVPFIADGLRAGQPVFVAVPTANLELLRNAFGERPPGLSFVDITVAGRNPAQLLALELGFSAEHPGRTVRMVGQVMWPGRSADERPACVKHEALTNTAFTGHDMEGLCPYDVMALDNDTLADARLTHPLLWRGGTVSANPDYSPDAAEARYNRPLAGSPDAVTYLVQEMTDLSAARAFAGRYAAQHGLSPDGIADLQLIATELATNSLRHAGGACRLAFWRRHGHLVCQASDNGLFANPLAGTRLPAPGSAGGRGLFLVNAISDLVRTYATATGTTIQAFLRLEPGPDAISAHAGIPDTDDGEDP